MFLHQVEILRVKSEKQYLESALALTRELKKKNNPNPSNFQEASAL